MFLLLRLQRSFNQENEYYVNEHKCKWVEIFLTHSGANVEDNVKCELQQPLQDPVISLKNLYLIDDAILQDCNDSYNSYSTYDFRKTVNK